MRCFVALQPDDDTREQLDRLAHEQRTRLPAARPMRRENHHLTLAFIGGLDDAMGTQIAARLATETVEPFDWWLCEFGAFEGARVLWAGGATSAALDALAKQTRRFLDQLAVRYDRKRFVPHVTLLRKVPRSATKGLSMPIEPPIRWRVRPPILLQSCTDARGTRYLPVGIPATGGASFGADQQSCNA